MTSLTLSFAVARASPCPLPSYPVRPAGPCLPGTAPVPPAALAGSAPGDRTHSPPGSQEPGVSQYKDFQECITPGLDGGSATSSVLSPNGATRNVPWRRLGCQACERREQVLTRQGAGNVEHGKTTKATARMQMAERLLKQLQLEARGTLSPWKACHWHGL